MLKHKITPHAFFAQFVEKDHESDKHDGDAQEQEIDFSAVEQCHHKYRNQVICNGQCGQKHLQ